MILYSLEPKKKGGIQLKEFPTPIKERQESVCSGLLLKPWLRSYLAVHGNTTFTKNHDCWNLALRYCVTVYARKNMFPNSSNGALRLP